MTNTLMDYTDAAAYATREARAQLYAALAAVQAELPSVPKNKTADAGPYTYKYADLADINDAIMPLLGKNGLAFTAFPQHRDGKFGLSYHLTHASGALLSGFFELDDSGGMQKIGGRITYARRYCLSAVTGIASEEDTDAQGTDPPAAEKAAKTRRGRPPIRAAGNLPKNADGSVSRSQATDEELADTGQMTGRQLRDHNRLERDTKGTGPQGTERLAATPADDDFYTIPPGTIRPAKAAVPIAALIHQRFKDYGYSDSFDDRTARLQRMGAIIGRQITTTNDLTASEGIQIKRVLEQCPDLAALDEFLAVKAGEEVTP